MGTVVPVLWGILVLTVKRNTVMSHLAKTMLLAMPLTIVMSVFAWTDTLEQIVKRVLAIPHLAIMELPVFLSLAAMNVSVTKDTR